MEDKLTFFDQAIKDYVQIHKKNKILWTRNLTLDTVIKVKAEKFVNYERAIDTASNQYSVNAYRHNVTLKDYIEQRHELQELNDRVIFCIQKSSRIESTLDLIKDAYKSLPNGENLFLIISLVATEFYASARRGTITTYKSIFTGFLDDKVYHFSKQLELNDKQKHDSNIVKKMI